MKSNQDVLDQLSANNAHQWHDDVEALVYSFKKTKRKHSWYLTFASTILNIFMFLVVGLDQAASKKKVPYSKSSPVSVIFMSKSLSLRKNM
jgi:hypothetical protein